MDRVLFSYEINLFFLRRYKWEFSKQKKEIACARALIQAWDLYHRYRVWFAYYCISRCWFRTRASRFDDWHADLGYLLIWLRKGCQEILAQSKQVHSYQHMPPFNTGNGQGKKKYKERRSIIFYSFRRKYRTSLIYLRGQLKASRLYFNNNLTIRVMLRHADPPSFHRCTIGVGKAPIGMRIGTQI